MSCVYNLTGPCALRCGMDSQKVTTLCRRLCAQAEPCIRCPDYYEDCIKTPPGPLPYPHTTPIPEIPGLPVWAIVIIALALAAGVFVGIVCCYKKWKEGHPQKRDCLLQMRTIEEINITYEDEGSITVKFLPSEVGLADRYKTTLFLFDTTEGFRHIRQDPTDVELEQIVYQGRDLQQGAKYAVDIVAVKDGNVDQVAINMPNGVGHNLANGNAYHQPRDVEGASLRKEFYSKPKAPTHIESEGNLISFNRPDGHYEACRVEIREVGSDRVVGDPFLAEWNEGNDRFQVIINDLPEDVYHGNYVAVVYSVIKQLQSEDELKTCAPSIPYPATRHPIAAAASANETSVIENGSFNIIGRPFIGMD